MTSRFDPTPTSLTAANEPAPPPRKIRLGSALARRNADNAIQAELTDVHSDVLLLWNRLNPATAESLARIADMSIHSARCSALPEAFSGFQGPTITRTKFKLNTAKTSDLLQLTREIENPEEVFATWAVILKIPLMTNKETRAHVLAGNEFEFLTEKALRSFAVWDLHSKELAAYKAGKKPGEVQSCDSIDKGVTSFRNEKEITIIVEKGPKHSLTYASEPNEYSWRKTIPYCAALLRRTVLRDF